MMNRDDIIRMAHKAGGYTTEHYPDEWRLDVDDLARFADLVAAAERDRLISAAECFRMCEHKGVCDEKAKNNETN
jgi:hypothetical protein